MCPISLAAHRLSPGSTKWVLPQAAEVVVGGGAQVRTTASPQDAKGLSATAPAMSGPAPVGTIVCTEPAERPESDALRA